MAEEKRRTGRKTSRTSAPTNSTTQHGKADPKKADAKKAEGKAKRAPGKDAGAPRIPVEVRRALPVGAVVLAFVSIVLVYRWVFPPAPPEPAPEEVAPAAEPAAESEGPSGVEDPWVDSGDFSIGDAELDYEIKAFCDALSLEDYSAEENAQVVYNAIVWSTYAERTQEQKPAGNDWDIALMRNFFNTGNPEAGEGGMGDVYEFAATTSYCLRYFGFDDAMAVPVLRTDDSGNETSSALVLVSNADGKEYVCDPALSGEGWMLKRSTYDIVVENLGQDLTAVKEMGLKVKESPQPTALPEEEEDTSSWTADESAVTYEDTQQSTDQGTEDVYQTTDDYSGDYGYSDDYTEQDTSEYQDVSYDDTYADVSSESSESYEDYSDYSDYGDYGESSDSGYVEEGTQYEESYESYDAEY